MRDLYEVGDDLLLVATDRLSAFDVVLPTPIPDKGRVLTQLSLFWFDMLRDVIPNHVLSATDFPRRARALPRAARRPLHALPHERIRCPSNASCADICPARDWKDYRATGKICGIALPPGLRESDRLPEPIFTPSTKATDGPRRKYFLRSRRSRSIGGELAEAVRAISLEIYRRAAAYAEPRGIILADTKFEFGLDRRRTDLD